MPDPIFHLTPYFTDPIFQLSLGLRYAKGEGVAQDWGQAVEWYRKAADQGNFQAQYNLGLKYLHGKGIPQNYFEAYKWCSLSLAKNFNEKRSKVLEDLRSKMTPDDVAKAQEQAQTLWQKQNSY